MLIDVEYALACVCSWGALCTDLPRSLALAFGHVHTLEVVYVRGGALCTDSVFGTSFWPRSYVVWSVCHGG